MQDVFAYINAYDVRSDFQDATNYLRKVVDECGREDFLRLVLRIGIIPELLKRDSSQEKLFSKLSELVLARAFFLLGFDAEVVQKRSDSADVVAKSRFWNYSLVADAKFFRLSRTAKNQKDFKIRSLAEWRKNESAEAAVLVAPYYQYPIRESQVFRQAMDANVCLFTWETLYFLIQKSACENGDLSLRPIWDFSKRRGDVCMHKDSKNNFLADICSFVAQLCKVDFNEWSTTLAQCREATLRRGQDEIDSLNREIAALGRLSRAEILERLIASLGLRNNVKTIQTYLLRLENI